MMKGLVEIVVLLLLTSLLVTGAQQSTLYNTPKDTLVYARSGDTRLLDPAEAYDTASSLIIGNVYETLVEDNFENGKLLGVKPMLATEWKISEDGKTYTFKLRRNVTFHDGTKFNASAVKYSLDRATTMGLGPAGPILGPYESSRVIDEYTIEMSLKYAFPPFLLCLGHTAACIVSPTAVKAHGGYKELTPNEWMRKNMVGTGPYMLDHWTEDEETLLVRNDKYWGEKPRMKNVLIKQVSEKTNLYNLIRSRDVDIVAASTLMVEHAVSLMKEKGKNGIVVDEDPSYTVAHLMFNCQRAPLNNIKVRQAIAYAIDYKAAVNDLMAGQAYELHTMIANGIFGSNPDLHVYSYNLTKANRLLDEAGYPKDKNGKRGISLTYMYNDDNDFRARLGIMLQQNLKSLGIDLTLQPLKWGTLLEYEIKGDFYLAGAGWLPDYSYGDNYLYPLVHSDNWGEGGNYGRYKNERVDELIDTARKTLDENESIKYYYEIQDILEEEVPYAHLYQLKMLTPRGTWVHGHEFVQAGLAEVDFAIMYKD